MLNVVRDEIKSYLTLKTKDIRNVESIEVSDGKGVEIRVSICVSFPTWGSYLANLLLDIEYSVRTLYKDMVFEFIYPVIGIRTI